MQRAKTRTQSALEVWDYFYISNVPQPGDEKVWGRIERATCRILKSDPFLHLSRPADVRVRSARRIRNAARLALRQIEQLSVAPEKWVLDQLAELEAVTSDLIETLSSAARSAVVH